jgi:Carbohydrate esterase, sialic acid-specific acetylesterase
MNKKQISLIVSTALLAVSQVTLAADAAKTKKPLKIFVLAGQSNMQGKAQVRTIARLNMTEDSKQMYADMMVKNGLPSAVKDVYGVYFTGGDGGRSGERALTEEKGPFQPGYGGELTETTTFGPDYTFGIYMQKHLNEPFLIIKTAWGGRDLLQQFRPPSAGPYEKDKDKFGNPTGHYYNLIVKSVNEVLADPGKYHPAYDKAAGCEITGFVWFQGFNDIIKGGDPAYQAADGKPQFAEYSRLLACFIRDIRKDLKAPKMPFVIGVMGIGGAKPDDPFRKAQEAPAALPEFKGNVAAVQTGQYWDPELVRIEKKLDDAIAKENPKARGKDAQKLKSVIAPKVLTPEEQSFLKVGTSNEAFHYMGSAYIYGNIGKAFADAMEKMMR